MLDSNGTRLSEKIFCFICGENHLGFDIYTPEHGHDGLPVSVGSCIDCHGDNRQIKNYDGSKFFEILPYLKNDLPKKLINCWVIFSETSLKRSFEPYHYFGYHLPNFGFSVGNTIYVCKGCVDSCGSNSELLREKLSASFWKNVRNTFHYLTLHLFMFGLFGTSRIELKRRFRDLPESEKRGIADRMLESMHNFKNMRPTEDLKYCLDNLYKLNQIIKVIKA